jgi:hypothetical protein
VALDGDGRILQDGEFSFRRWLRKGETVACMVAHLQGGGDRGSWRPQVVALRWNSAGMGSSSRNCARGQDVVARRQHGTCRGQDGVGEIKLSEACI